MDIATQVARYFAVAADAAAPGEATPAVSAGNNIVPMIDGRRYFRAISALLSSLGSPPTVPRQFFYLTNWFLHFADGPATIQTAGMIAGAPISATTRPLDTLPVFRLEGDQPGPSPIMADLLVEKADAGVDVRVMGWVNPLVLLDAVASRVPYWAQTVNTLLSIRALREQTVNARKPMAKRACALTVGHAVGAMHLKMVVAHDGTRPWAFIGGIDFSPDRVAGERHTASENWHDMVIAVDGPAVQVFYDLFRNLWNEQLKPLAASQSFLLDTSPMSAVEPGTDPIPARVMPVVVRGQHRVQVARTLPQFHIEVPVPSGHTPLSFAPGGLFEIPVVWRRAIQHATDYIYIEDQGFFSHDVMDWINARVKTHPTVKVILLGGARDPTDPPNSVYTFEAITNHLLAGLSLPDQSRIGFFKHSGVIVHAKVTIIDDHWLFVGSANCSRRSLYTDGELSVGCLDENDTLAKQARVDLWGGHFGKAPGLPRAPLNDLNRALAVWEPTWGAMPPFPRPAEITQHVFPLPAPVTTFDPNSYTFVDPDSRETFRLY